MTELTTGRPSKKAKLTESAEEVLAECTETPKNILDFPEELLLKILKEVPLYKIPTTRLTCRKFERVCEPLVWVSTKLRVGRRNSRQATLPVERAAHLFRHIKYLCLTLPYVYELADSMDVQASIKTIWPMLRKETLNTLVFSKWSSLSTSDCDTLATLIPQLPNLRKFMVPKRNILHMVGNQPDLNLSPICAHVHYGLNTHLWIEFGADLDLALIFQQNNTKAFRALTLFGTNLTLVHGAKKGIDLLFECLELNTNGGPLEIEKLVVSKIPPIDLISKVSFSTIQTLEIRDGLEVPMFFESFSKQPLKIRNFIWITNSLGHKLSKNDAASICNFLASLPHLDSVAIHHMLNSAKLRQNLLDSLPSTLRTYSVRLGEATYSPVSDLKEVALRYQGLSAIAVPVKLLNKAFKLLNWHESYTDLCQTFANDMKDYKTLKHVCLIGPNPGYLPEKPPSPRAVLALTRRFAMELATAFYKKGILLKTTSMWMRNASLPAEGIIAEPWHFRIETKEGNVSARLICSTLSEEEDRCFATMGLDTERKLDDSVWKHTGLVHSQWRFADHWR